jgi:hypothetical protein
MSIQADLLGQMDLGYTNRKSASRLSVESGVALDNLLDQLEHLVYHGCALRWSDNRWSLTPIGVCLRDVLVSPLPSRRAA